MEHRGFYRYSSGIRDSQFPAMTVASSPPPDAHPGQTARSCSSPASSTTRICSSRTFRSPSRHRQQPKHVGISRIQSQYRHVRWQWRARHFGTGNPHRSACDRDLANGRGADLHVFGNDLDVQINDGISLSNKLMYSAGEMDLLLSVQQHQSADSELVHRRRHHVGQ